MGTRCLTRIFDGDEELCTLYRHFDGYPDGGHGEELASFLGDKRIVNGFSSRSTLLRKQAMNGAGDLAAKLIAAFSERVQLYKTGAKDCWEEYEYHVKCPTYLDCDRASEAGNYNGLPVVLEMFCVRGGHGDVPRTLERWKAEPEDDDADSQMPGEPGKEGAG